MEFFDQKVIFGTVTSGTPWIGAMRENRVYMVKVEGVFEAFRIFCKEWQPTMVLVLVVVVL